MGRPKQEVHGGQEVLGCDVSCSGDNIRTAFVLPLFIACRRPPPGPPQSAFGGHGGLLDSGVTGKGPRAAMELPVRVPDACRLSGW